MSRIKHWFGKDDITREELEELLTGDDEKMIAKAQYELDRRDRLEQKVHIYCK